MYKSVAWPTGPYLTLLHTSYPELQLEKTVPTLVTNMVEYENYFSFIEYYFQLCYQSFVRHPVRIMRGVNNV